MARVTTMLRLSLAGLIAGLAGAADAAQSPVPPDPACVAQTDLPGQAGPDSQVYFMTTRQPDCGRRPVRFKGGRGEPSFGYLRASQPILQSETAWQNAVRSALGGSGGGGSGGRVLVYVHGYFNSFEDAASRAQQIRERTGFAGPVLMFSWPSVGCVLPPTCYTEDEENALWTQPAFDRLLTFLLREPGVSEVVPVAHSMGNRIVLRSVAEADRSMAAEAQQRIRTVVLASPDIDRAILERDHLPVLDRPGRQTTVYASRADRALRASWKLHGYPRAGDTGCGLLDLQTGESRQRCLFAARGGVVLVDTSLVRGGEPGHSDFVASPAGAADFCRVLAGRTAFPGRVPMTDHANAFFLTRDATASDRCPR